MTATYYYISTYQSHFIIIFYSAFIHHHSFNLSLAIITDTGIDTNIDTNIDTDIDTDIDTHFYHSSLSFFIIIHLFISLSSPIIFTSFYHTNCSIRTIISNTSSSLYYQSITNIFINKSPIFYP